MSKTIENKTTAIRLNEDKNANYADLLVHLVNVPIKEGLTVSEMKRNLRVLDILEVGKDAETLEFTKEDFKFLQKLVTNSRWGVSHKDIIEFVEYVEGL